MVTPTVIICGCSDGIIRLFEPISLVYIGTLPKPFPLAMDLTLGAGSIAIQDEVYPDVAALALSHCGERLTAIYADRSMIIWDVKETKRIAKLKSFLPHSDVIWGVEVILSTNVRWYPLIPKVLSIMNTQLTLLLLFLQMEVSDSGI